MNNHDKTWESVKSEYLKQVENELASAGHPRSSEILEDVAAHLDRRYEELSEDQHTWENYQAIITDMGPASDYTELLEESRRQEPSKVSITFIIGTVVLFTVIAVVLIALPYLQNTDEKAWLIPTKSGLPHPFQNDPRLIGTWKSVDFVRNIEDFQPGVKLWQGDLFLKRLVFTSSGRTSMPNTWTKDWIYDDETQIKAQYKIVEFAEGTYLFFPWLSGDVTIRGRKPCYYVLEKVREKEKQSQIDKPQIEEDVISTALRATKDWLKLVDKLDFVASWQNSAGYFRRAIPQTEWQKSLEAVRVPLGEVISRKLISEQYQTQVPGAPDGQYIIFKFQTVFENKDSAVETVTPMLDEDGQWRVSGYYIK